MARSVFVDTSGWYALIDRRDAAHGAVAALVRDLIGDGARLVTTDYVVDESCTLAKVRAGAVAAGRLLDLLHGTAALDLEWIGPERFDRARSLFRKHHDQAFSFTDCASFAVMRERRIAEAITTDDHFRVAGFQALPGSP
ncbi:MAG: type II toxin-antitoxin system VapC family toxin [Gemmatimonadetes bacterium]|nr:type II toxin-antitoxin system VapC family toxin [Gemmatimonadota bacterium]